MINILSKLKYPKFILLILSFVLAYLLFSNREFAILKELLSASGYIGGFATGILFVYGFTAPIATALLLLIAKTQNIWLTGFIAGFGALLGDFIIFKFIKHSFKNEIELLKQEKIFVNLHKLIPDFVKQHKITGYFTMLFAGFVIASPLPDEIGVSLLAISTDISDNWFLILSYILNTCGIFVILLIGNLI